LYVALVACWLGLAGCSRHHYHRAADNEVHHLVAEKQNDPRWCLPRFTVYMDSRSRYHEPYDEDRPPMPQDDPASHRFMHRVDHKHGYRHWHKFGDRPELENPWWRQQLGEYVELTADGKIKLTLESAMLLAQLHSPNYQQELEDIYLSALDVSTERFRFDVQFLQSFSGSDTIFTNLGNRRRPPIGSSTLEHNTDLRLSKQFATAGELLVGFANSTVWQFAGPNTYSSLSILNFSLVQPLLRAGGRAIALEQLTIVERLLLANLRAFMQYRQGFFTQIAIGDAGVQGPSRRGGFAGGTGLTGFSGTGATGLGGVGQAFGRFGADQAGGGGAGGGGTAAGFAGGGAGNVGGFIGLLQTLQQIRNSQESLSAQQRTLALLEAHLAAGVIGVEQVDQFRQQIQGERASLLQAEVNLANALEAFASVLGLPPDLSFELEDTLIRQFQFIDPTLGELQDDVAVFQTKLGDLPSPVDLLALKTAIAEGDALQRQVVDILETVQADLDAWKKRLNPDQPSIWPTEAEKLGAARKKFAKVQADLDRIAKDLDPKTRKETYVALIKWTSSLLEVINDASLVQARARVERIAPFEKLDLSFEEAIAIARAARLDWMNRRAELVDVWRLIEFNANALKSNVDVIFNGDIQTLGDNPFRFRAPTGSLQVGLQIDGPFNRLLERNSYRQQLIEYQRARRGVIQYEDNVYRSLRAELRALEQLRENLELQRSAVAIAVRRVDQTREQLSEPPPPVPAGVAAAPQQFSPTAALNLLTALSDLRNTQNNFMSVWLVHYATRMQLYRDLGIMELDDRGIWVDRPLSEYRVRADDAPCLPPEVPQQWLIDAGIDPSAPNEGPPPPQQPMPGAAPLQVRGPGPYAR
jgi:hypothetical protein